MQKIILQLAFLLVFSNVFADSNVSVTGKSASTITTANNTASIPTVASSESVTVAISCPDNSSCAVVSSTTKALLSAINKNAVPQQIEDIVAPQFDFTLMTRYALGNNWKTATASEQLQLVSLFKQLLIYTYSSALYKFKGAQINIISANEADRKSAVISEVTLPNANRNNQTVKVEYDLARRSLNEPWKAYDIKIENASLVTTYRNQFNDVIQSNKIPGLIKVLKTKVEQLKSTRSST